MPSRMIFTMGFRDSTLVFYRLATRSSQRCIESSSFLKQPVRICVAQKLHKSAMGGVAAVKFISNCKNRVVSVGHDGKCRLIDFKSKAIILRTWYVSGSATSVAVLILSHTQACRGYVGDLVSPGNGIEDGEERRQGSESLIAIGTAAGKVLLFNLLGLLLQDIDIGFPVTYVSWIRAVGATSVLSRRVSNICLGTDQHVNHTFSDDSDRSASPSITRKDMRRDSFRRLTNKTASKDQNQVAGLKRFHKKHSKYRPRVQTETFSPLSSSVSNRSSSVVLSRPDIARQQHKTKQIRAQKSPTKKQTLHSRHRLSQTSIPSYPDASNPEFFTPPSTRRNRRKDTSSASYHEVPTDGAKDGPCRPPSFLNAAFNSVSKSVDPHPGSHSLLSQAEPNFEKRKAKVDQAEIISSEWELRNLKYNDAEPSMDEKQAMQSASAGFSSPPCPIVVKDATATGHHSPDSASSMYSRSISGKEKASPDINTPTTLDFCPRSRMDPASSKALDGGVGILAAEEGDGFWRDLTVPRRLRLTNVGIVEMARLREDMRDLIYEVQALRAELGDLKTVLLGSGELGRR